MKLGKNQQAWVDALKSGVYKQGVGHLQSHDAYCCLGVACKVAEKDGVTVIKDFDGELNGMDLGTQPDVVEWLGLKDDGTYLHDGMCVKLIEMNDDGVDFNKIADTILHESDYLFEESK